MPVNFADTWQEAESSKIVIEGGKECLHPLMIIFGHHLLGIQVVLPGTQILSVGFKADPETEQQSRHEDSQVPQLGGRCFSQFASPEAYRCRRLVPLGLKPG